MSEEAMIRRSARSSPLSRVLLLPPLALLLACEMQPAPEGRPSREGAAADARARQDSAQAPRARLWDRDGLEVQTRLAELRGATPAERGFDPGTTAWRAPIRRLPATLTGTGGRQGRRFASPGAATLAVTDALGIGAALGEGAWEVTARVLLHDERTATALIMQWGLRDDAVAGNDWRLTLEQRGGGWYIVRVEERSHCARGVSGDGLCV